MKHNLKSQRNQPLNNSYGLTQSHGDNSELSTARVGNDRILQNKLQSQGRNTTKAAGNANKTFDLRSDQDQSECDQTRVSAGETPIQIGRKAHGISLNNTVQNVIVEENRNEEGGVSEAENDG